MDMTPRAYQAYIKKKQTPSPLLKNTALAFVTGGAICVLGQLLINGYGALGLSAEDAAAAASVSLVFLSAVLTALGLYHRLARFAGAGTLVPITGFANAVAAPALEFKREGLIPGTCARMFVIAGPVIVYGVCSSVIYGVILVLLDLI
jgi:stage V sporulation protein AC